MLSAAHYDHFHDGTLNYGFRKVNIKFINDTVGTLKGNAHYREITDQNGNVLQG